MDFDQLGEHWRRQDAAEEGRDPVTEIRSIRERARELDRAVRRRDRLETGVAIVMLPLFVWVALTSPYPVSAAGAWILVAACILTPLRLRAARKARPLAGSPLAEGLRAELTWLRGQERLLGTVAWWYVGPIALGAVLLVGGGAGSSVSKAIYTAIVAAGSAWIVRLNRKAVRNDVAPVTRTLEGWLADLEGGSEPEPDRPDRP